MLQSKKYYKELTSKPSQGVIMVSSGNIKGEHREILREPGCGSRTDKPTAFLFGGMKQWRYWQDMKVQEYISDPKKN